MNLSPPASTIVFFCCFQLTVLARRISEQQCLLTNIHAMCHKKNKDGTQGAIRRMIAE